LIRRGGPDRPFTPAKPLTGRHRHPFAPTDGANDVAGVRRFPATPRAALGAPRRPPARAGRAPVRGRVRGSREVPVRFR
jgi:hypothetical protein